MLPQARIFEEKISAYLNYIASGNTAWGFSYTQKQGGKTMNNGEIYYKIHANVGTIAKYPTGWTKEVNIVSWNGGAAKVHAIQVTCATSHIPLEY